MKTHTPRQMFREACIIAKDHNCFVIEKGSEFLVYRKLPEKNVCVGRTKSAQALRTLVCRITGFR